MSKGKIALVTGGAGFIGSHMADRLIRDGWHVRIIDNFSTGKLENIAHHKSNSHVEIIQGDLKNLEDCLKAIKGVEAVFHFAANPEIRISTMRPVVHFNENIVATFNLLESIREKCDSTCLVFASSSSVYGEPKTIPIGEDALMSPVSVYGASKAACENLIHAYSTLYGIRSVALRYANVVGPRLRHGVLFDLIMKLKGNSNELEILGDGKQIRSYIYIDDAIEASMTAFNSIGEHFELYNVGSESWIMVTEIADAVCEVMNLKPRYIFKPMLHGVGWLGDVKRIALKVDRIKSLGWRPRFDSMRAIEMTAVSLSKELNATNSISQLRTRRKGRNYSKWR